MSVTKFLLPLFLNEAIKKICQEPGTEKNPKLMTEDVFSGKYVIRERYT